MRAGLSAAKNTTLRLVRPTVEAGVPLVAVSLPNGGRLRYTAGQWVFLCVPRLGLLHWHPFTIASSSHDSSVELAVACKGAWTLRLAALAESVSQTATPVKVRCALTSTCTHEAERACMHTRARGLPPVPQRLLCSGFHDAGHRVPAVHAASTSRVTQTASMARCSGCEGVAQPQPRQGDGRAAECMQAYLEGPYGAPMIDVHGSRYKCFLLISGGIGWTFLRSWRRQLLQDAQRGRPVRHVTTVAVMRATDQHHMPEITDTLNPEAAVDSLEMPAGLRLEVRPPACLASSRPPCAFLCRVRAQLCCAANGSRVPGVPMRPGGL